MFTLFIKSKIVTSILQDILVEKRIGSQQKVKFFTKIRDGSPIEDFKGIEFLGTQGFGLESLPQLYKEYRMKKCNGIFAIDMRDYDKAAFNMSIAILTEEGLPRLYESWKNLRKRQIFIFTDSHPMIAIMVADAKLPKRGNKP